jgi:hypothetical protein
VKKVEKKKWFLLCSLMCSAVLAACGVEGDDSTAAEQEGDVPALASVEAALTYDIGSAIGAGVVISNTCGAVNQYRPVCASSQASDHSYLWTAPASGSYTFSTQYSGFDTILQLYTWPGATPLACNDDALGTRQSSVTAELSAGQRIIIVVDGYASNCGAFYLHIRGPRLSNQPYVGRSWSFQSYNYTSHYMRHRASIGYISQIWSALDRQDATFRIVNGLADPGCVSFESRNYPGSYLRHEGYLIKLHGYDASELFRKDATFCLKPGLSEPSAVSFESYNYPGSYIRHRDSTLWSETGGGDLYRSDATFRIVAPWAP